jgi:hypothetical protein
VLVMKSETIFGRFPERFILVGPVIEGLVGGLSVFNGVTHAYVTLLDCCRHYTEKMNSYISDCTRHGSR